MGIKDPQGFKNPSACNPTNAVLKRIIGAWRSLVARLLWEQEVGGSNPLAPTNKINWL